MDDEKRKFDYEIMKSSNKKTNLKIKELLKNVNKNNKMMIRFT